MAAALTTMQSVTNSDFLSHVYSGLGSSSGFVCWFAGNPMDVLPQVWKGRPYFGTAAQAALIDRAVNENTYFSVAAFTHNEDGELERTVACFHQLRALVVDDVPYDQAEQCSYYIETSPGNGQAGILLDADDPDTKDAALCKAVIQALTARGLIKGDKSGNNLVRWVRLPVGVNGKPRASGEWHTKLHFIDARRVWTLEDAASVFGIDLDGLRELAARPAPPPSMAKGQGADTVSDWLAMLTHPNPSARSYHEALTRWSASMVASGMAPGAVTETLRGVMAAARPSDALELARWQSRFDDIPRIVRGAEKYAPAGKDAALPDLSAILTQSTAGEHKSALLSLSELARAVANVRWLVKAVVPDDALGMLFGASGTYKSFTALDLALHVSLGRPWMGRKTRQGPVVYIAAEGGAGIYRRIAAWCSRHACELPDNFYVCTVPLVLSHSEHVEFITEQISKLPEVPALVVVDTLAQTFSGDENSASDIGAYLRGLNTMRAALHCALLVIHHSGHSAAERPRGSSALTANVDFLLGAFKPDGTEHVARIEVVKQKDGERLPSQTFSLERIVLGADEDGDEISSLVALWADQAGTVLRETAARVNTYEQTILAQLTERGELLDHELRNSFYNYVSAKMGGKYQQDSARRAYTRAIESMVEKGLITRSVSGRIALRKGEDESVD